MVSTQRDSAKLFTLCESAAAIMDAIRSSRKRNHSPSSPSHPLYGRLTRSRSQIFVHCSRSGLLRSDPGRRHKPYAKLPPSQSDTSHGSLESNDKDNDSDDDMVLAEFLCKKTKWKQEASSTGGGDELARVLRKDLRARRVYSPQSSAAAGSGLVTNVFSKGSDVDSDCGDRGIADLGFGPKPSVDNSGCEKKGSKGISSEGQNKDDPNSVLRLVLNEYRSDKDSDMYADDESESPDLGLSPKAPNFDLGNAGSSDKSCKLQDEKQCGGVSTEKTDDLTEEELVQTILLGAELCAFSEVKGDDGKRVEEEVAVEDTSTCGNAVENTSEGFCRQRNDCVLKSKSPALRPRLQEKLFKAPGSVSFGRLFSFLMDITGDGSGTRNSGHLKKDEKGVNGQETPLPLSTLSQEGDVVVAPVNELSHGNGSKLTSSHHLHELPVQLHTKVVASDCLSVPSTNDKCLIEAKTDLAADFHCAKEVGNALPNDDLNQDSKYNSNPDYAKNHSGCTFEQCGLLNEECVLTTPPDADICDKSEANKAGQLESNHPQDLYNVKAMDISRSTQEIAGEGFCLKTDKRKDSTLRVKSVPRSNLHRKLFRNSSVSYRRLLPFIMDFNKDEYGHQSCRKKAEADMHAKRFQLPLPSQSQEASIDEHKIDSGPVHGIVESIALVNNILVDPTNELSHGNHPKLTSCHDNLPELPMQLDAKELVHESLSVPSVNEHIEKVGIDSTVECPSDSKFDLCTVMVDFHCGDNAVNANEALKQVQNKASVEQNGELPPKAQNVLYVNGNVSNLTPEHYGSERKQFVSLEKGESVSIYPPEGQSLNHLDTSMPDVENNEKRSHAIGRSEDGVVLNHVSISNEESRPSPEKIILEKSDMAGHGGHHAGYVLKGKVYSPRMPTKRSNKNANCVGEIRNSPESKTTLVINRCSQKKLLKHAGSLNYKRLLPYVSNTMKDNSCAFPNDHCPKVQKCLDQTPILPLSASDMGVTPISGSNGCAPMGHCGGSAGTQQQTGLHFRDLNSDRSSPISEVPKSKPLHASGNVIQQQHELVVSNGRCKLESSPDPRISDHRIELPVTPLGPNVNEAITSEVEPSSALLEASTYSEVKGNSSFLISPDGEKSPETNGHLQSLSQETVLEKSRVSAIGFKKGILKRNPRGCRGLCTCLNCASFRLHAERAFEFSRNQYLDAKEVAQDLMKELSQLRDMLESSTDSSSDNPVFDGSQAKEACRKASVTEQLSKDRLSQMNDDLNIHCRLLNLQRPRVRFSDHVEEKIIQPDR